MVYNELKNNYKLFTIMKKISKKETLPMSLYEQVLGDILHLHMTLNEICDHKANFLLGVSGIILTIALTKISSEQTMSDPIIKFGFLIIIIATLISAILSILATKPKIGKKFKRINLFYYANFIQKLSRDEYVKEIQNLLKDKDKIEKQYAEEIYDFGCYDLAPRFKKINIAVTVLLTGLIIGTILITTSWLIQ
jgi:hypothetical protein